MTSPAMPSMRQVKGVSVVLIWVGNRVSRFAISVRTSAISVCCWARISARPALNWSDVKWSPCSVNSRRASVEGVRLGGREVGGGQRPSDSVRACRASGRILP